MSTELSALDELKLLSLKAAHPEANTVSAEAVRGVFNLAFRALADKDAVIARLRAELDAASDAPVEYVTTAGLEAAMKADPAREDGVILRCTDGERQSFAWRAARGEWEPAP